ncbi:MAG: DUF1801 domain-containing protein [Panacibacter sp.]
MNKEVDNYIAPFPKGTQDILRKLRTVIKKAAPGAEECINYGIPTFTLHGNLVHFGGYKTHIGFYPAPSGIVAFQKELSVYDGAKGSIKFPIDQPLPFDLISKIVKFRVQENLEKAADKKGSRTSKKEDQPEENLLLSLSAPAKRALENKGIKNLKQLAKFSEAEILELHGIGPSSIPKLTNALKAQGLSFKKMKP